MKKLFLPLICFLTLALVSSTGARMNLMVIAGENAASGVTPYCASCTGTPDADSLCEGFEASEYDCSWTESSGGSPTIDGDTSRAAGIGCTDAGTYALRISRGENEWGRSIHQLAAAKSTLYVQFYIYLSSFSGIGSGESHNLFVADRWCASDNTWTFDIKESSGSYYFQLTYYNDGASFDSDLGGTAISTGNWYPVRVKWVSGTSVQWWVDYNNDGTFDDEGTDTTNIGTQSILCVAAFLNSDYYHVLDVQYDNIKVDDDTMPTGCAR